MLSKFLTSPWAWLAWAAVSVSATVPGLLWHLDFFSAYGPRFRNSFPLLVLALLAACIAHHWARKRGWWRYELALLSALAVIVAACYQPLALLVAIWIAAAAFALGHWILRRLGFLLQGIAEEIALSCGVGLAGLIAVLFVLGLLRIYYPVTFVLLLGLPCLLFFRDVKRLADLLRAANARWASMKEVTSPLAGTLVFFFAVFLLCNLAAVLSPSLLFDALAYHLAGARFYAESHALAPLPFQPNSYLPQGFEVVMAAAYALAGQPAAQMIAPMFTILAAAMTFAIARQCGIASSAALAGVALATMVPLLHFEGGEVKNDFALAFFLLCALHCCLRWQSGRQVRWILLSAFLLASGFSIKHVALFAAVPLAFVYLAAIRAQAHRARAATLILFVLAAAGGYWQARTFLLTGNPVYPFSAKYAVTAHTARGSSSLAHKLAAWLETPWRAQFKGREAFESKSPSPLGAVFVFLIPVWLWPRRESSGPAERLCWFFAALYLLYWSFEWGLLRFAIAPILLLTVLLSDRLVRLYQAAPRATRLLLIASLFYSQVVALCVVTMLELNADQLRLFARQIDWTGYLLEWPAIYRPLDYLRHAARPDDLVLSVDDCAAAYAPNPARFHGICRDEHQYSPDTIRAELSREDYRFLILPRGLVLDPTMAPAYQDASFAVYRLSK